MKKQWFYIAINFVEYLHNNSSQAKKTTTTKQPTNKTMKLETEKEENYLSIYIYIQGEREPSCT